MRISKLLIIITIFLIQLGCKETIKEDKKIKDVTEQVTSDNFEADLKNKKKFFLSFWEDMSREDYYKVVEILKKENKLSLDNSFNTVYNAGDCKTMLSPEFEDGLLQNLTLKDAECLYGLFEEKYGVTPLKIKDYTDFRYEENNPDYQPVFEYFDGNANRRIPQAFYDNTQQLPPNEIRKLEVNSGFENKVSYLADYPIEINSKNSIILIDQDVFEDKKFTYSLDKTDKMREYRTTNYEKGGLGIFGKEFNQIKSNSVLREVSKYSSYAIHITYFLKNSYLKSKKLKEQELRAKKKNAIDKAEKNKRRKNNALDEI